MSPRHRSLAALLAGALAVPAALLAAPALADGEQDPPTTQSIDSVCDGVPADYEPFRDVEGNRFEQDILCLAYLKVARGGADGAADDVYVPGTRVGRDAMATFVARLLDAADSLDTGERIRPLPAYDGSPAFSDVSRNVHVAGISRLANAGIVQGRDGRYAPSGDVTRAQVATFLDKALEFALGEPVTATADYYTDDDGVHESRINEITSLGIASGRAPDTYAPDQFVDRDNLAAFLARTLAELAERRAIESTSPPAEDDITVTEQEDDAVDAVPNPDRTGADDRTYGVTGLAPGEEYRVTLVEVGTLSEDALGETVFSEDGDTGLAAVGTRTADITTVNGERALNNGGDATARTPTDSGNGGTAVANATAEGTLSFVVDLDADSEAVVPVVYRNGGPVNADADGGQSPRLELDDDGTAAEAHDLGGVFGENISVTPASTAFTLAVQNPDTLRVDDRTYTVTGLVPGQEYRVTVVDAQTTRRNGTGETVFTEDGDTGLAALGSRRSTDIVSVDGAAPLDNTGDGTATTPNQLAGSGSAVTVAGEDGTATFMLDADGNNEWVLPVVYRNGGPGNARTDGGVSPRLELREDGVPAEAYDVGGPFSVNGEFRVE